MKIFSLIQARGGSKGIPNKNIKLLGGHPLIAYSIAASKLSKQIQRTIVSTDHSEIAEIAKKYGAEVPFLRPAEFAKDNSTDLDVFTHAINWLRKSGSSLPDFLVQLRPTTPLRDPTSIDEAVNRIRANLQATSLRSAHKINQPPQKMFQVDSSGFWAGFFPNDKRPEYYNMPRQAFPDAYSPNGYVDILKPKFIKDNPGQFYGPNSLSFITPFIGDIDSLEDFEYLEFIIQKHSNPLSDYLSKCFSKQKIIKK